MRLCQTCWWFLGMPFYNLHSNAYMLLFWRSLKFTDGFDSWNWDEQWKSFERWKWYCGSHVKQPNSTATSFQGFRPAHLEILFYVKINVVTLETPVSTLRGLLLASNHDHLSFSKKELWKVEEQMSKVLKEFYHKLRLVKRYRKLGSLFHFLT